MDMEMFFNVILPLIIAIILEIYALMTTPSLYELGLMDSFLREHPEYGIEPFFKLEEEEAEKEEKEG